MKSGKEDIFLGGILINPLKVFGMTSEPILKGYRRDLHAICKEEFMNTGSVDLVRIYDQLKALHPTLRVASLIAELVGTYNDYCERKLSDRRDFGNAYCRWPRES